MSLKQRLLLLVLSAVSFVWLATAAFTYKDAQHELDELLDAHLAQASTLLIAQSADELDEIESEHAPLLHKYSRNIAFQLWEEGKKLRFHSINSPLQPLASTQTGFSTNTLNGKTWRVFTTWDNEHEVLIHVAERVDMRNNLARDITERLILPLLITLPVLAIILWWLVNTSLRPLHALTQALASRDPENLSPLTLNTPAEISPVIVKLNHLFERTTHLIENERRFTADASHELRTPIAGIQAQVQVAQNALTPETRNHALHNALAGCQHATHLMSQLLTLARLEHRTNLTFTSCDLVEISRTVLAELAPIALDCGKELELLEEHPVIMQGLPELLHVLARNVVDNALRYTPVGTRITLTCDQKHHATTWHIYDTGGGLPENELHKITQRFYRVLGTTQSGSGLGLSIVQRIATLHNAHLTIANNTQSDGLSIRITFPRTPN